MAVDWLAFIGQAAVTSVLASGLTLWGQRSIVSYQHQKTLERDRLQAQSEWERAQREELRARVAPVLKTAGALETHVGGYAIRQHADDIRALLREFNTYPEQFADYPDVRAAIWAFQNTVNIILDDQWFFLSDMEREIRADRAAIEPPETPEAHEKRVREERQMREVQLPQTYRALVAAAKTLYEPPPPPPAQPSGWQRFLAEVAHLRLQRHISKSIECTEKLSGS